MTLKKIHFISGLTLTTFIGLHLFNHACSIQGADKHIEIMNMLRLFYRNVFAETVLLLAVCVQIFSGLKLFRQKRKWAASRFEQLQIWSGLYLAIFLIIHLSAVFAGRLILNLDTNFYFGVAGLNTFPLNLFFIPYYGLAMLAFVGHVAAIHQQKMKAVVFNLTPHAQAKAILVLGLIATIGIFYGLTNHFQGVTIPAEYHLLLGK